MTVNLISLYHYRAALTHRQRTAFLIFFVVPLICMVIQMFSYGLLLIVFGTSLAVLFMFVYLLTDQMERSLRQQQEIAHQRASIMVLQMRPHFIYNTMMSIYYLCKQDPDLAQRITLDFTTYLRKNFNAIASEDLIPFSEELEHTRVYLAVEKAQFEDSLFIDYDTPHTDFRVPPLTLQPIVENAVKHGMDPDSGPLQILIRTTRTDSGSEIIVENNGADFVPADDNEPHIALKNIQQRLEMMCHGKMTITPRDGGGTVVKVTIP
ncbi:MAG: histidine kinase [Eubacterium sp.]|nr:histidine kinase [Eubacterium sp.]